MENISRRQQKILQLFLKDGVLQSSSVHSELLQSAEEVSLITVKRELSNMVKAGLIVSEGFGRSVAYRLSVQGRVFSDIDAKVYCATEPDKRYGMENYNFDLFNKIPKKFFTEQEMQRLADATAQYSKNTKNISPTVEKKELERLVIELSWKSSRIEGNTYTLLDTEKLIVENIKAPGHSQEESQMILNHKDAFQYVRDYRDLFISLTTKNIEAVHALLVKEMGINHGMRTGLVGIIGSRYRPLDNTYQINDALDTLCHAVSSMSSPYEKALLALIGVPYIQPFEDGNKRTSRLLGNAVLLAHGLSPLSYRSVDEEEYREAMLVFYEINSIMPFKKIFIEQYEFASRQYAVS